MTAYAKEKKIHMLLATVPLRLKIDQTKYPNLPDEATFNSTFIVNSQGQIVDYDLKVRGSDWISEVYPSLEYTSDGFSDTYPPPAGAKGYKVPGEGGAYTNDPRTIDAVRLTNTTTYVREIVSKSGHTFRYATLICAERHSLEMVEKFKDAQVDVVLYAEAEGDIIPFRDMTPDFQKGGFTEQKLIGPYASWKSIFYDTYFKWNVVNKSSYFVGTDKVTHSAAAVRYDLKPIKNIEIANEYLYVEIPANR